jgi:hypothetical protein
VPDVDAGNGERLIIFGSSLEDDVDAVELVESLSRTNKVLISVPSGRAAKRWDAVAKIPDDFTNELESFRKGKKGAFLLVGRYDGIDLPGSTCRIMAIDGLPTGTTLLERYQFSVLAMDHFFGGVIANRLVQLFGRINRGRQDYAVFIVADKALENWLRNQRNIALFPSLLRHQIFLGEEIQSHWGKPLSIADVAGTVESVLSRNADWIQFYKSHIADRDDSEAEKEQIAEDEAIYASYAKAEVKFMTKLWDGDIAGARSELEDSINELSVSDPLLAGWYCIWIGMTYYRQGNRDAAIDYFETARRRVGKALPLPRPDLATQVDQKFQPTIIGRGLASFAQGDVIAINDRLAKTKIQVANLFDAGSSHRQAEESLRVVGAALGFDSTRPCTDQKTGPDNLWLDPFQMKAIAFELKTEKREKAELTKDEIGQGHNHIQWVSENYPDYELLGLIYLGEASGVSAKASPSPKMFQGTTSEVDALWTQFIAAVEHIRKLTLIERIAETGKRGELPEWSTESIFARLAQKPLKT